MAIKGRKPKPVELRVIEGNREHRPIPQIPKPRAKWIPAPRWLSKNAKKEWRRISRELYTLGLLTIIDRVALEAYCQCYAKWKEAEEKAELAVFKTESGYVGPNPFINIALKYAKELRAFLMEFGMTPSSRTRLSIDEGAEEDQMEKLLKRGRN